MQCCANSFSAFLKLPFKSDNIHHKIQKLIRRHSFPVHIVYEHRGSLRNTLCRSALNAQVCRRLPVPGGTRKRGRPKGTSMACSSGCRRASAQPRMLFTNSHARSASSSTLAKQADNWLNVLQNIPVMPGTGLQTHPGESLFKISILVLQSFLVTPHLQQCP